MQLALHSDFFKKQRIGLGLSYNVTQFKDHNSIVGSNLNIEAEYYHLFRFTQLEPYLKAGMSVHSTYTFHGQTLGDKNPQHIYSGSGFIVTGGLRLPLGKYFGLMFEVEKSKRKLKFKKSIDQGDYNVLAPSLYEFESTSLLLGLQIQK